MRKNIVRKILIAILTTTTAIFGLLTFKGYKDIKQLNQQIEMQQGVINKLDGLGMLETVQLTVEDADGSIRVFDIYLILELSIMDALLLNGYTNEDFGDPYPGFTDRYFRDGMTGVKELIGNLDYYTEESEWDGVIYPPALMVGLNNIVMDQNYTVIRY